MYFKIINRQENHRTFYDNFTFSKKSDIFLVDEPYGLRALLITLFLSSLCKFDLVVHNCNTWINSEALGSGFKFRLKAFLRRIILSRSKSILVVAPVLSDYLKNYLLDKPIKFYPFMANRVIDHRPNLNLKILVHPGGLSELKKYDRLRDIIVKGIFDEVVILGKSPSELRERYLGDILRMEVRKTKIIMYSEYVNDKEFHRQMLRASEIFVDFPANIVTREGYSERFGITKESGAYWLALQYGIPIYSPLPRPDLHELSTICLI